MLSAPTSVRYGVALAATSLAVALRFGLDPIFGRSLPYILSFLAIMLSAWFGGLWPGLVSTALSAVAAAYLWLEPVRSLAITDERELVGLAVFVAVGAVISGVAISGRRAVAGRSALLESEQAARVAAERANEQLRLAVEAGRMGMWEFSIRSMTVKWSPGLEAIHGLEPGTFPGTFDAVREEIHPEDRDRVLAAIDAVMTGHDDYLIEYRIIRPDGKVRWVEGRAFGPYSLSVECQIFGRCLCQVFTRC